MAAKKTRKPTKKTAPKAAKPASKPKKGGAARAQARVERAAVKKKARAVAKKPAPARRPAKAAPKAKPRKPEAAKPAKAAKRAAEAKPAKAEAPAKAKPAEAPKAAKAPSAPPPKPSKRGSTPPEPTPSKARAGKPAPADRRSSPGKEPTLKRGSTPPGRGAPLREAPARLVSLPLPILAPPKRPTIEERSSQIEQRLTAASPEFKRRYEESLDMSWIYHDSALEGVVYTFEELRTALSGQAPPVTDSSLQPTYDDIRRHKEAIEHVRRLGQNKREPITVDDIKKIYLILHPEEGDIKTVKYRKDIPQHRLYFHEYAPPDKIAYKVRQIVEWLNDPETRKTRNGIRIAARAHYDLLRVYPFPTDSGKVSRLFMNLLLIRSGLPPAIIHSTERQRYYEALKGSATTVLQMVQEAVENALASVEKLLDEHETKKRAFVS
jgi:Fic family protein